jgi:hypothetical protein
MTEKVFHLKTLRRQYEDKNAYPSGMYIIIAKLEISSLSNQTPYFSVTGEYGKVGTSKDNWSDGCIHEEIAKQFPEVEKYIKWHLVSLSEPMHYLANSLFWAGFQGWCNGKPNDPPNYKHLRNTCIYSALESDYEFDIEKASKDELTQWLEDRLPNLMLQFDKEMKELFPDYEIIGGRK